MEDQRNWIDASFKTFCTPLRLPYPVEIVSGTRVTQSIQLTVDGPPPAQQTTKTESPVTIQIDAKESPLPAIGLGMASHDQPLTQREREFIEELAPAHLRADIKPGTARAMAGVDVAITESLALDVPLELAIHLPRDSEVPDLAAIASRFVDARVKLARVLAFRSGEASSSEATFRLVADAFKPSGAAVGVGTNADFYQLNQFRPAWADATFVAWSMNPQVHAFDNQSIAETPTAVPAQLASARAYFPGRPLVVSPVTLKPRFNTAASSEELDDAAQLSAAVDPRQLTPFAAAWTLAMLKRLAESGADAVTFYETSGWRGVLEREAGSPLPQVFPSEAGQLFPPYHALLAVSRRRDSRVRHSTSSDPLRVESLAFGGENGHELLLANLTDREQTVQMPAALQTGRCRMLTWIDDTNWRHEPNALELAAAVSVSRELKLPPYALCLCAT
jgi:hypothetical protein